MIANKITNCDGIGNFFIKNQKKFTKNFASSKILVIFVLNFLKI